MNNTINLEKLYQNCKNCGKNNNELQKFIMADDSICKKCNICRLCVKKIYLKDKVCTECCNKCKRCDKVQLKDNWPEDIIIGNMCNKCFHLCKNCDKYTIDTKAVYKSSGSKRRFCEKCFLVKFSPKYENSKHTPIFKRVDYGNILLRWKKTHEYISCTKCDKNFWNYIGFKKKECKKCKKINRKDGKNDDLIIKDPSDEKKKYTQLKQNGKIKYILDSEKYKCFKCFTSIWIKKDNVKKGSQYYCENCKPEKGNDKKLKYDKEKQMWVPYRIQINCKICKKGKWVFVSKYNNDNICTGCHKT